MPKQAPQMGTSRFRRILIALVFFSTVIRAEETVPPAFTAQNGLYKVYVQEILGFNIIKDENEIRILKKLNEPFPGASPDLPILSYLGYVAKVQMVPFGSIQYPGKKAETTYTDNGSGVVQDQRMFLADHFEDQFGPNRKRIYVFARWEGWPGTNSTCVILTDFKDDYILDWCPNEQVDMFEKANYDPADHVLHLECRRRQGGEVAYSYTINPFSISKGALNSLQK